MRARLPEGVLRVARTARFLRHIAGQARFPFRPWKVVQRAQAARLAATVRFAYDHVPYYRSAMDGLGLRPRDIRTVDDLAALPVVDTAEIPELGHALLPGGKPAPEWSRLRSGGSMGAPKTVYLDTPGLIAGIAVRERARIVAARAIGKRTGYREAVFAPPEGVYRWVEEHMYDIAWAPRRMRVQRSYFSLYDDPRTTLPELAAFGAHHFHGYGSHIGRLFQAILESGEPFPLPRAVTYSSDEMPDGIRRAIVEDLGIPVFSIYGAVEALTIGFTCGEGEGFHLNADAYPIRVVDDAGRSVPPGETGSIMVSNLVSRGTMLLNYRIGDLGRLVPGSCPCGRTLPRLAALQGRNDEWVARAGGGRMHAQAVRTLFTHEDERVWRYQVVQEEVDRFRVTIVPAVGVDPQTLTADVTELFRRRFGPRTEVELDFVSEIEQTSGGKVRPFHCRVGKGNGAAS